MWETCAVIWCHSDIGQDCHLLLPKTIKMVVVRAATWGHVDFWARADTEGHVWALGPIVAEVCVAVCGPCYHDSPCRCPWSELLTEPCWCPSVLRWSLASCRKSGPTPHSSWSSIDRQWYGLGEKGPTPCQEWGGDTQDNQLSYHPGPDSWAWVSPLPTPTLLMNG